MSKIKDYILQEIEKTSTGVMLDEPWPNRIEDNEVSEQSEMLPWCWSAPDFDYQGIRNDSF